MNQIHVLDCTLRDGGYCNNWEFGYENKRKILKGLIEADLDVIECGFLTNKIVYDQNGTKFTNLSEISEILPTDRKGKIFVAMVNFGEYDLEKLPCYDGTSIDGIRVAFHKKDREKALEWCRIIGDKGYKVYIQPMVTISYTDGEFLELIQKSNELEPESFYVVDSFGFMRKKDLLRLFRTVEKNLKEGIKIGFHSHNNMQLAYANAQTLEELETSRDIIIDTSVMGMGRGAGNLNTELFVEYLNEERGKKYDLKPLLILIDEVLSNFYDENYWGYSLPNYLSAKYATHPNYAGYLDDKKTLTYEDMNAIFSNMEEDKRVYFDKEYMEQLYNAYMRRGAVKKEQLEEVHKNLKGKKVLLIAPGKSAEDEKDKIIACSQQPDVVTMEINFKYQYIDTDYLFLSNLRRYRNMEQVEMKKAIVTSNILSDDGGIKTDYAELLNANEYVKDNAGMMAVKFLIQMEVAEIMIAGMDGYSHNEELNYMNKEVQMNIKKNVADQMNRGMEEVLKELSREIPIIFVTEPKYIRI